MTAFRRTHCLWLVKIAVKWIAVQRYIHSGQRLRHCEIVRAGVWFPKHCRNRWFLLTYTLQRIQNEHLQVEYCCLIQMGLWNILWKWLLKLTWDSLHIDLTNDYFINTSHSKKPQKNPQNEQLSRNFRFLEWNHATVTYWLTGYITLNRYKST